MTGTIREVERHDVEILLVEARQGSLPSLGQALEMLRNHLCQIAEHELSPALRSKVDASDLVQDSFIEAQRDFEQFHGASTNEWMAWLTRILHNNLEDNARRFQQRAKRQVLREVSLDGQDSRSGLAPLLAAADETPSAWMRRREESYSVVEALNQLPEAYQQVLRMRCWDNLTLDEIGHRIGRSSEAVRKLWSRAVQQLTQDLAIYDSYSSGRRQLHQKASVYVE